MRLSSRATYFYKRIFPILFFIPPVLMAAIALFGGLDNIHGSPLPFILVPFAIMGFFFYFFKKFILDLADEVIDEGHTLLVRNGGKEDRIALADIANVNYNAMMSPPRVTLSLHRPSSFGSQVSFCAPLRFIPFATSPVIDKFILRVDAARRAASRRS